MKKNFFKILIAFLTLAFFNAGANADVITREDFENTLKEQIKAQSQKYVDELGGGDIEVKIINLPYGDIITKNEAKIVVKSNFDKFMYRDIKRVFIYDGQTLVRSLPISANVLVYKNVLCAKNTILREQTLNSSNTKIERLEVGQYLGKTFDSLGKNPIIATKNYSSGSVILKFFTKAKPDVEKDSIINIVFHSKNNLKIKIDGKALREGNIGDNITVKSSKYNKIYQATVSNKNEVTVKI